MEVIARVFKDENEEKKKHEIERMKETTREKRRINTRKLMYDKMPMKCVPFSRSLANGVDSHIYIFLSLILEQNENKLESSVESWTVG